MRDGEDVRGHVQRRPRHEERRRRHSRSGRDKRSKGKFYADGWSTSHSRVNYALVAGVMLVVIVAVYLAMGPMGISLH